MGDDLFIRIICNRYPEWSFVVYCEDKYSEGLSDIKNLIIITKNFPLKILDKISELVCGRVYVNCLLAKMCYCAVQLGGSVYIQTQQWRSTYKSRKEINRLAPSNYLIGGNFGPFTSRDFLDAYRSLFNLCSDVCFRDKYSYEMFKDVGSARYAPDVVFSMRKPISKKKTGGITIIPIQTEKRADLCAYSNVYYKSLAGLVQESLESGRRVTIQSFCAAEGDQIAINNILSKIDDNNSDLLTIQLYTGDNLERMLETINRSEAVVSSRFHGMILGCYFETKIYPVVYSDKMENFLIDIGFSGHYAKINQMKKISLSDILYSENLIYSSMMKSEAEGQFIYLDSALGMR